MGNGSSTEIVKPFERVKTYGPAPRKYPPVPFTAVYFNENIYLYGNFVFCSFIQFDPILYRWKRIKIKKCPPARRGNTINVIDDLVYVVGGISGSKTDHNMLVFDLKKRTCKEIPISLTMVQNRYGHSASVYNNELYVWGGKRCLNKTFDFSEPPADTWLYIISKDGNVRQYECSGEIPLPRLFHSSNIHKDQMYICGGYVDATRFSNTIYSLDLKTYCWSRVELDGKIADSLFTPDITIASFIKHDIVKFEDELWFCGETLHYDNPMIYKFDLNTHKVSKIRGFRSSSSYSAMVATKNALFIFGTKSQCWEEMDCLMLKKKPEFPKKLHKTLSSRDFIDLQIIC